MCTACFELLVVLQSVGAFKPLSKGGIKAAQLYIHTEH